MKLLFDENLSPKLSQLLDPLFPGSTHVHLVGLGSAGDDEVWTFARDNGFVVVTKDADYNNLSVVRGTPPKLIWLLTGNCTTSVIEELFRDRYKDIEEFGRDVGIGTMALR